MEFGENGAFVMAFKRLLVVKLSLEKVSFWCEKVLDQHTLISSFGTEYAKS